MSEALLIEDLNSLSEAAEKDGKKAVAKLLRRTIAEIELRDGLLDLMQGFVEDQQADFEATLGYEERELYRAHFGLGDSDEDPFDVLREMYPDLDDEDSDLFDSDR